MRIRKAIKFAKFGILILIFVTGIDMYLELYKLKDSSDSIIYLLLLTGILKITGYLLIQVFFYTFEDKLKPQNDK